MTDNKNIEKLKQLVLEGVLVKLGLPDKVCFNRLAEELALIDSLGFTEYLLIGYNICQLCDRHNIIYSCNCNSLLVCHSLNMSKHVNPLEYDLLFENYFNLNVKGPVFKFEVSPAKKSILIDKIVNELDYSVFGIISKFDENNFDGQKILYEGEFYEINDTDFIICKKNDTSNFELIEYNDSLYVDITKIEGEIIAKYKFGIYFNDSIKYLEQISEKIGDDISLNNIPLNDKKTFDLINDGNTEPTNIFENSFMQICAQFEPSNLSDLALLYTINQLNHRKIFLNEILENKKSDKNCQYSTINSLNQILKQSYGVIVYNETITKLISCISGVDLKIGEQYRHRLKLTLINQFKIDFKLICKNRKSFTETEIEGLLSLLYYSNTYSTSKSTMLFNIIPLYFLAYYKRHFRKEFDLVCNNLIYA